MGAGALIVTLAQDGRLQPHRSDAFCDARCMHRNRRVFVLSQLREETDACIQRCTTRPDLNCRIPGAASVACAVSPPPGRAAAERFWWCRCVACRAHCRTRDNAGAAQDGVILTISLRVASERSAARVRRPNLPYISVTHRRCPLACENRAGANKPVFRTQQPMFLMHRSR